MDKKISTVRQTHPTDKEKKRRTENIATRLYPSTPSAPAVNAPPIGVPVSVANATTPKNVPIRAPSLEVGEIWPTVAGQTEMKAPEKRPGGCGVERVEVSGKNRRRERSGYGAGWRTIDTSEYDHRDRPIRREPEGKAEHARDERRRNENIHAAIDIRQMTAATEHNAKCTC